MAKRKEERYVFDASAGTVKIPGHVEFHDLLMIVNATRNTIIFNQFEPGKGGSKTHSHPPQGQDADFPYSVDGVCVFTLDFDTAGAGMADADELSIYIDDELHGLKVKPWDFGTDAIERTRVSTPQSLIDADFEYGLQDTKWQNIGLNRNVPFFSEAVGPGYEVTAITTDAASPRSTITVTVGENVPTGTPVSVSGTDVFLAEGTFITNGGNASTNFTYVAKGLVEASGGGAGSIYTPYSVVRSGIIFSGAELDLSTLTGDGATTVTAVFNTPHGLVPGSIIFILDTTAGTQAHEGSFYVNTVTDDVTIEFETSSTVTNGSITLTNVTMYAQNESFFVHRPFDGGISLGTLLTSHGLEAKRQTRRYFRYQSGKGILFTAGSLFTPSFSLRSATFSAGEITFTTEDPHGIQKGAGIEISGIKTADYNGDYTVKSVTDEYTFVVDTAATPTTPAKFNIEPRATLTYWYGSSVRIGIFDDANGMFWEFDGQNLYAVRRTSTKQITGTIDVTSGSHSVTGNNTRFLEQLTIGEALLIKGQKYIITGIISNTSLSISPEYRGASNQTNIRCACITELRIPSSKFNYDILDGTGASGYNFDPSRMQMMGIDYSWYGAGFIDFMLRGPGGEMIVAHRMPNNNLNYEAYMRSGNLPARYEVINCGAQSRLASASGTSPLTGATLDLEDVQQFPDGSATYPVYGLLISNQGGTVYQEVVSYTGIDRVNNQLTGVTRNTSYSQFISGANRTFTGTATTYNHPADDSTLLLLNTVCAPRVSHWGSSVIMDGQFDNDDGYLFSVPRSVQVSATTSATVLLFRAAPSVSNTVVGELGDREVINRAQIKLKSLEINNLASGAAAQSPNPGNVIVTGMLNATNLGTPTWINAQNITIGGVETYQPSFAQYATSFSSAPTGSEVLFSFLAPGAQRTVFDLSGIKEIQNSILGGNNPYPDGPEVLAIVIRNNDGTAVDLDLKLQWTEAQA